MHNGWLVVNSNDEKTLKILETTGRIGAKTDST